MLCDHNMISLCRSIAKEGRPSFMGSADPINHAMSDKKIHFVRKGTGMLNILIYGDSQDREILLPMLERAKPISDYKKEYTFLTDSEQYFQAIQKAEADLVIVSAVGEPGRKGIRLAKKLAPTIPRIWVSDDLDDCIESYRLECTWFLMKPLENEEKELELAVSRFLSRNFPSKRRTCGAG